MFELAKRDSNIIFPSLIKINKTKLWFGLSCIMDPSCIIAYPINTFLPFDALVLALTTVLVVRKIVHTRPFAAQLTHLTLVSAPSAVGSICINVNAFLIAAIRTGATL